MKIDSNDIFDEFLDNNNNQKEIIEEKKKVEAVIKLGSYEVFSELTEKQQRDRFSKTTQLLREQQDDANSASKWLQKA